MRKQKYITISRVRFSLLLLGCFGLSIIATAPLHAQEESPSLPGSALPDDGDLAPLSDEALDAYLEQNAALPLDESNMLPGQAPSKEKC